VRSENINSREPMSTIRNSILCTLTLLFVTLATGAIGAQEAPRTSPTNDVHAGPDLPVSAPKTQASVGSSPSEDTGQAPPVDPSEPDGPRSEKAAKQSKLAELTPIVPSPHDVTKPAYQLFAETDLPLVGIGLVFASARLIRTQPAYCAPECNRADLNVIDRSTAGFWSPGWSTASDIGIYSMAGGAAAVLVIDEGALPALNDALVVAESGLMGTALASVMTLAAGRPRPFLFGEKAPLADRNSPDGGLSFLSSHATVSFAIVTSLYVTERRLHPGETLSYVVLGAGLAGASFVGTARVLAGRHFITDSVGGAIVGTSVGVLVPALHGSPVKVVPMVTPQAASLSVVGSF
jgi:membrane-associated phospholipid phosphatase